jgi:hypothetical protein
MRLEAASWFMTAHLVMRAEEDRLRLATLIRYEHPIAGLIWPPVSLVHRWVGRTLMRRVVAA